MTTPRIRNLAIGYRKLAIALLNTFLLFAVLELGAMLVLDARSARTPPMAELPYYASQD